MTLLFPHPIRRWGETWTQVDQHDHALLFRRTHENRHAGWVITLRRLQPKTKLLPDGTIIRAGTPLLPKPEDFGTRAWNYLADDTGGVEARWASLRSGPSPDPCDALAPILHTKERQSHEA